MKKTFRFLLSFIIVVALTVTMFVFNVSAASATISGAGEYEVGKTFSVTIKFNADATLYAVEADVSYNSSVLKLNGVSGADYNAGNGTIKIVDDGFSATKPSNTSSYTLNFTAIAAGNSNISVSLLGGGDAESKASASVAVTVVTPKPSSNANLTSIRLSNGSLSPSFNANTTNYNATVKYGVDSITITGTVADGGATYTGGGTFGLEVGNNQRVLTVTAADGTKKTYTINIKRMSEQETLDAEQAAREADPLLVIIDDKDYTIVNDFEGITIPAGFTQGTAERKESEIAVLNDEHGEYQLFWLVDENGENGAFYTRDENDVFSRIVYIFANGKMYIVEEPDIEGYVPEAYVKSTRAIDGMDVKVYNFANEELNDFCIIKCYVGGTRAYYRFDSLEGTMQRASEFDTAVKEANAEPDVTEQNIGVMSWFTNMSKTGKAVFLIIVFAAVLLIAVAVVLIIKIVSQQNDDYQDDFVYNVNDGFILNDFADDETSMQSQNDDLQETEPQESEEELKD